MATRRTAFLAPPAEDAWRAVLLGVAHTTLRAQQASRARPRGRHLGLPPAWPLPLGGEGDEQPTLSGAARDPAEPAARLEEPPAPEMVDAQPREPRVPWWAFWRPSDLHGR